MWCHLWSACLFPKPMKTGRVLKPRRIHHQEADGELAVIFKTFPVHKKILFCSISFMLINLQMLLFRYYPQNTEHTERHFPVFMARFKEKNFGIPFTMGVVALTSPRAH